MNNQADEHYLIPNRLADVIRLIVVLSVDKYTLRSEKKLKAVLKDDPKSSNSWLELAKDHPEFFRFTVLKNDEDGIGLLIRFAKQVKLEQDELRDPLTVNETQKLVDQAIELHDKQLARYQRDSHKYPIYASFITSCFSLLIAVIALGGAFCSKPNIEPLEEKTNQIMKEQEVIKTNIKEVKEKLDKIIEKEATKTDKETKALGDLKEKRID